jgi:mono/diheme cytochrome c family protein
MKFMRTFAVSVATLAFAGFSSIASADAAAGKAKFAAACAECHEADEFVGEDAKALADSMKQIIAGKAKHKEPLKLTDAEIVDLAAFMAAGK